MTQADEFIQKVLLGNGLDYDRIKKMYDEPHRFYHNWDHIESMVSDLLMTGENPDFAIVLAIIFHDIVYDPRVKDGGNERASVDVFLKECSHYDDALKDEVKTMILDTIDHKPKTEKSAILSALDMSILDGDLASLIEYEKKIFKEFQFYDYADYRDGRIKFLNSIKLQHPNVKKLIDYVEFRDVKIAIYPGTFSPFHNGHMNILKKAEQIFDKVIIARGINSDKNIPFTSLPRALEFHQCEQYHGLTTDFIKSLKYDVTVIRGLRNATDLQFELTQYRFLQDMLPSIKIASIFCDKEFEHISSSAIRSLQRHKMDDFYLPK